MFFVYEDHLGGLYISPIEIEFEDLYCEQCGDSDTLLDFFQTLKDAEDFVKEYLERW